MDKESLPKLETDGFKTINEKSSFMWQKENVSDSNKEENHGSLLKDKAMSIARRITNRTDKKDDDSGYRRLLIKTGICAGIAVVILAISTINTPTADIITQTISNAVNHEFDIDEDIGRLKFVETLDENMQSVFSPGPVDAVVFALDGEVMTCFGEGGSSGVRILPNSLEVVSIAKGTVAAIGEIDGNGYVKIVLDSGQTVAMYNVTPEVLVDDIVSAGQRIGEVSGQFLYIEMKDGGEYIDPIEYIKSNAAKALQ